MKKPALIIFSFFYFLLQSLLSAQDGKVELYYDDGSIKAELNYVQGVLNGFSVWYFPNGNKEKEVYYSDGKIDGTVKYFYENGLLKAEFNVKNGVRDGLTKFYYPNGGLKEVKSYEKGKLVKTVKVSYDPNYVAPIELYLGAVNQLKRREKENNFLCGADKCPEPIGGMKAIQEKIVYPQKALLYGLEGKVILVATIDKKGKVEKIKVEQGLGLGCTEAAIEAVKKVRFLPAESKGKIVKSWVALTINFKIPKKGEKIAAVPPTHIEVPEPDFPAVEKTIEKPTFVKVVKAEKKKKVKTERIKKPFKKKIAVKNIVPDLQIKILSCDADVCPSPIGGTEAIKKNLVVPRKVKELKLEGNVIVLTTVDEFGNVRDTHVIQRLGHGCDEAAEVAILDTRFKPGKKNGKRVRSNVKILIPYSYRK